VESNIADRRLRPPRRADVQTRNSGGPDDRENGLGLKVASAWGSAVCSISGDRSTCAKEPSLNSGKRGSQGIFVA